MSSKSRNPRAGRPYRKAAGRHPSAKSVFNASQKRWFFEIKRAEKMLPHMDEVAIAAMGADAINSTVTVEHPHGQLHTATSSLAAMIDERIQQVAMLDDIDAFNKRKAEEAEAAGGAS